MEKYKLTFLKCAKEMGLPIRHLLPSKGKYIFIMKSVLQNEYRLCNIDDSNSTPNTIKPIEFSY